MSGSSPEAEAVTASAGTLAGATPSNAATAARRWLIALTRSGLFGPRLDAPELVGS